MRDNKNPTYNYKTNNTTTKIGTIRVNLGIDTTAFRLALLEEQYKMKVRIINDLDKEKRKQTKELSGILDRIYSIKESA